MLERETMSPALAPEALSASPEVRVIDVPLPLGLNSIGPAAAGGIALGLALLIALSSLLRFLPRAAFVLVYAGSVLLLGVIAVTVLRRRARERGAALVANERADLVTRLHAAADALRSPFAAALACGMAEALARQHATNTLIRVAPAERLKPIQPMEMPFEPRPLEDCGGGSEREADGVGPAPELSRRRWRTFLVRGGWAALALVLFNFLMNLLLFWKSGSFPMGLLLWGLALAALLLFPTGLSWLGVSQWLVAPGGLILRRSGWREDGWAVHVFDRRRSVLITVQLRGQCGFAAADDEDSHSSPARLEEIEFAARSWASSRSAPDERMLSDLRS